LQNSGSISGADDFLKKSPAGRFRQVFQRAGELELSQQAACEPEGVEEFAIRRFTTDALPAAQRLPIWREEFGRTLVNVDITLESDEAIQAEATMRMLPGLRSLSFRGSAMCLARTQAMVAAGDDSIGLIINRDDGARLSQRNRDVRLRDGDACPILTDEPGMISGRGHLGLLFPREPLIARVRNIADVAGLRIPKESESLRLLVSYLSALPEKLMLNSPKLRRTVVEHIYDLAALAIFPHRRADENSLSATAAARLELALGYIKKHFDMPGLTIAAVARNQNISPRYLQRLIETTGSTFSENVNELRLQRAYALLSSAPQRRERISDIALRAGFSDIAHFNRLFRRRFGDTPRAIRASQFNQAAGR
jgi:AraC-like DNA-binding protein